MRSAEVLVRAKTWYRRKVGSLGMPSGSGIVGFIAKVCVTSYVREAGTECLAVPAVIILEHTQIVEY